MPIIPLVGTIGRYHHHAVIRFFHDKGMKRNLITRAFDGISSTNFTAFKMSLDLVTLDVLRPVFPLLDKRTGKDSSLSEFNQSSQDTEATIKNNNLVHLEDTLVKTQQ